MHIRLTLMAGLLAATGLVATGWAAMAADDTLPRLADGHPDFSGIWQTTSAADYDLEPHATRSDAPPGVGVVVGDVIPYLPAALEHRRQNFAVRATADSAQKCYSLGVPRSVYYPEPFQILQRANDLTLIHQRGYQVRTIWTNGSLHPLEKHNEYWLGDSRGTWQGDTLVVDVTDFNDETWLDRSGNFHSTDLHVVERWRFVDANTIEYQAWIEDPQVFSKAWEIGSIYLHRHREKNFQLVENYCYTLDYDKYYPPRKD
jgi:hypothetical protein